MRDGGREDEDLGDGPTPGDRGLYQMTAMRSGEKERERERGWREGAYEIQGKGRGCVSSEKNRGVQKKPWDPRIQGSQWGLEKGASAFWSLRSQRGVSGHPDQEGCLVEAEPECRVWTDGATVYLHVNEGRGSIGKAYS